MTFTGPGRDGSLAAEIPQAQVSELRYPVARPDLSGNEERYVVEALRSSWISSTGPFVRRFEADFAALCGTRAAIAVSNGTVALHLALLGLDVGAGDEVLVPSLTYVSTANAVRYVRAEPIFIDVDPATWCIDPSRIEEAITPRTRGIIAVHLYGHPADMDALNEIASRRGLWVVEDAAEAPLARYKNRPVGSLGSVATFSFYGNKVLTSGEGGALTLDDEEMERRLRILRGQGMDPERRYHFPVLGYNYRLTNVACALLCAQLERHEDILAARRRVFEQYRSELAGTAGIGFQPQASWAVPAPWLFCITVDPEAYGCSRDELAQGLERGGVDTRPLFPPLHQQPGFSPGENRWRGRLAVTERLAGRGLSLPTYNSLSASDVASISEQIRGLHRSQ